MSVKIRFAPSPTGYLHAGNIRTALVNWLFARKMGGHFLLRIDDTDAERSRPEYENAIKEDLAWLGLNWDSEERQANRLDRYFKAAEQLHQQGRLYACYETPEELDIQRKMQASRGLPPIYNRAALALSDAQKAAFEAEGRRPHYRFLLNDEEIFWHDLIRGETRFKATHMSDPVLFRQADGAYKERGFPLYTISSVVDDGEMDITHVIRGEDHVSNTAVQVQLYQALGFAVPQFAHMALLKTKEGELSKRLGGNDIRSLRDAGILPMAINSLLARIGTSDAVEAFPTLAPLVESFDFNRFGRAPANYDALELQKLNEKLIHRLPFDAVKDAYPFMDEPFWLSIRVNLTALSDAPEWWKLIHGELSVTHDADDAGFLEATIPHLPPEPWNEGTWDAWLQAIKAKTDRQGKRLFLPIRKALTGMDHGPELKKLLPLIGRDKVVARLLGQNLEG